MTLEFVTPEGATPLEPDELDQLIPTHITTMAQLNEAEQLNISSARISTLGRRRRDTLSEKFAKSLHKKMFGDVWRWAGTFRTHAVNIGNVDAFEIGVRLRQLFDDVQHWIDNETFPVDETAARLHHGLTVIHPFPNGNGRHARLMADALLKNMGELPFSWGNGGNLVEQGELRQQYLAALRAADNYDMAPLITFCRS